MAKPWKPDEIFYREVVEHGRECVAVLNLEGRLLYLSEHGCRVMEIDDFTQVEGSNWLSYWEENDRHNALKAIDTARAGGRGCFQGGARTTKGTLRWWDAYVTSIRDARGQICQLVSVCHDITSQRENYEAQRRLAAIVESSDDAIIGKTLDGIVTTWNAGAERLFGYKPEEMIGTSITRLFPAERLEEEPKILKQISGGERVEQFETIRLRKDGKQLQVSVTISPVKDDNGQVIGVSKIVHDISERMAMMQTLRQSEENLSITLRSIGDGVLATDAARRVTRMNPIAEQLTGWRESDALGKPVEEIFRIINEKTRQSAVIPVDSVLESGEIHGLANHTILIARDGVERSIADSAAPIRDLAGKIFGVVLVFHDVTEERSAEKRIDALMQELLDVKRALDQHSIVAITDDAGKITYVNQKFCEISGYVREELLGQDHRIINSSFHPKQFFRGLWQTIKSGQVWKGEIKNRAKNGSFYWVETTIVPFLNQEAKPYQYVAVRTDITSIKRAQEQTSDFNEKLEELVQKRSAELRETERFAHAALNSLTALMVVVDDHGIILAANKAWDEFTSQPGVVTESTLVGASYFDACLLLPGAIVETQSRIVQGVKNVISGKELTFSQEFQLLLSQEKHWYICRATRFAGEGSVRVVIAHEDITQIKSLEQRQHHGQRLESLGTLAGGIAHDLNNSIAPIMMSVEMLRLQHPEETEMLDLLENSAGRAAEMVKQLLTFSKGTEGARIPVRPANLFKEMLAIMKGTFPKNIQLVMNCPGDLPLVLGDATQLHQVLLNLCVNARDAMPHGGRLVLEAERQRVDEVFAASVIGESMPGDYVVLRVKDNGMGMSPEVIERIFDPFFTTKGPDKGTGLGLSTVLGIVKAHDGFLRVYSQPGSGSSFDVYLPTRKEGNEDAKSVKSDNATFRGNGQTILFVDDEPSIREVACVVLRRLNFVPLTAVDGADALVQVATSRDRLHGIILDMHMPNMDGIHFARAVRRFLPAIPILAMSGRFEEDDLVQLRTMNITVHLRKPFTEVQLVLALQNLLAPDLQPGE